MCMQLQLFKISARGHNQKKWPPRSWCERRQLKKGYVLRTKGTHDPTPSQGGEENGLAFLPTQVRVLKGNEEQTGRPLLVVRPGERQW